MRAAYRAAGPEAVAGFRQVLEAMMEPEMRRQYHDAEGAVAHERARADIHLLIVDDDERIRGLLQKFLIRSGFLVTRGARCGAMRGGCWRGWTST